MTAVVSKYYKGISAERRKKEFFKAVGFEPRQVNRNNINPNKAESHFFTARNHIRKNAKTYEL